MYDLSQPRLTITSPYDEVNHRQSVREIGQANASHEAQFWLSLGYSVNVSRWDGQTFVSDCNYFPEDLL